MFSAGCHVTSGWMTTGHSCMRARSQPNQARLLQWHLTWCGLPLHDEGDQNLTNWRTQNWMSLLRMTETDDSKIRWGWSDYSLLHGLQMRLIRMTETDDPNVRWGWSDYSILHGLQSQTEALAGNASDALQTSDIWCSMIVLMYIKDCCLSIGGRVPSHVPTLSEAMETSFFLWFWGLPGLVTVLGFTINREATDLRSNGNLEFMPHGIHRDANIPSVSKNMSVGRNYAYHIRDFWP
jgi:hypothetical protein